VFDPLLVGLQQPSTSPRSAALVGSVNRSCLTSVAGLVLGLFYIDTLLVFLSAMDEKSSFSGSRLCVNELIGFSGVSLPLSVPLNGASNLTNVTVASGVPVVEKSVPALDNSMPVKTFKEVVVPNVKV